MSERRRKHYEVPDYKGLEGIDHLTEAEKHCVKLRFWIAELEWLAQWESFPGDGRSSSIATAIRVMARNWKTKYPPPPELLDALAYHRAELQKAEARAHPPQKRRRHWRDSKGEV